MQLIVPSAESGPRQLRTGGKVVPLSHCSIGRGASPDTQCGFGQTITPFSPFCRRYSAVIPLSTSAPRTLRSNARLDEHWCTLFFCLLLCPLFPRSADPRTPECKALGMSNELQDTYIPTCTYTSVRGGLRAWIMTGPAESPHECRSGCSQRTAHSDWSGLVQSDQTAGSRTNCTNCTCSVPAKVLVTTGPAPSHCDSWNCWSEERSQVSMPMCPATSATYCPGSASFHPLCLLPTSSTRPDSTLLLLKPRGHHSSHFPSSLPPSAVYALTQRGFVLGVPYRPTFHFCLLSLLAFEDPVVLQSDNEGKRTSRSFRGEIDGFFGLPPD